jgi:hypothetical protein
METKVRVIIVLRPKTIWERVKELFKTEAAECVVQDVWSNLDLPAIKVSVMENHERYSKLGPEEQKMYLSLEAEIRHINKVY